MIINTIIVLSNTHDLKTIIFQRKDINTIEVLGVSRHVMMVLYVQFEHTPPPPYAKWKIAVLKKSSQRQQ